MPLVNGNAQRYLNFALFSLLSLDFPVKSCPGELLPTPSIHNNPCAGASRVTWWGYPGLPPLQTPGSGTCQAAPSHCPAPWAMRENGNSFSCSSFAAWELIKVKALFIMSLFRLCPGFVSSHGAGQPSEVRMNFGYRTSGTRS